MFHSSGLTKQVLVPHFIALKINFRLYLQHVQRQSQLIQKMRIVCITVLSSRLKLRMVPKTSFEFKFISGIVSKDCQKNSLSRQIRTF